MSSSLPDAQRHPPGEGAGARLTNTRKAAQSGLEERLTGGGWDDRLAD
jgi:hypothetical protein